MDPNTIIGYCLAILVGITLGLLGSGGSILSVPIMVYVLAIEPVLATAYSLFVVGTTALVGGVQKAREQLVDFKKVVLFGLPSIIGVFATRRFIVPEIPAKVFYIGGLTLYRSTFIMLVFAVVMFVAAIRMIRPQVNENSTGVIPPNYFAIITTGLFIGFIAGFVGAGGGFLIIPALVFLMRMPMKMAVGTSLFIIASQSLLGFLGDVGMGQPIDWILLLSFTGFSVFGIFIGNALSKKIPATRLKTAFGWFVLVMALYIIGKELL